MHRFASALVCLLATAALAAADKPFRITVVDSQTRRGVPLVFLTTVHGVEYVTDSAGVVAFDEPGLMNQRVYFHVRSDGYEHPRDGFGNAGKALDITPGASATIELNRRNLAHRLYRVTGAGIYRDSVILGDTPPIARPLLNAGVMGSDSVQNAIYRGRLYWFWGDTNLPRYPLGIFHMTGATTPVDFNPERGPDLQYFTDEHGAARAMCPMPGKPGAVWLDAVMVVPDEAGREAMLARYQRVKNVGEVLEQGLVRWNDAKEIFEPVAQWPLDAVVVPHGHPVAVTDEAGKRWLHFGHTFPLVRCPATLEAVSDLASYEAYTPLKSGAKYDKENPALERGPAGRLVYAWKKDTALLGPREHADLVTRGLIAPGESLIRSTDRDKPIVWGYGTTSWNAYRRKWITLAHQLLGDSVGGEVWYLEADAVTGPWTRATKIATHDDYTFYNVRHHPYADADGGRVIYFEGTYTTFLTRRKTGTPRYDYNQIMYRLELDELEAR